MAWSAVIYFASCLMYSYRFCQLRNLQWWILQAAWCAVTFVLLLVEHSSRMLFCDWWRGLTLKQNTEKKRFYCFCCYLFWFPTRQLDWEISQTVFHVCDVRNEDLLILQDDWVATAKPFDSPPTPTPSEFSLPNHLTPPPWLSCHCQPSPQHTHTYAHTAHLGLLRIGAECRNCRRMENKPS